MFHVGDTITEAQRLGRLFFDLDFPCTQAQFKSAFRKAAKALHTDTSGGDTKEKFVRMKDAYDVILHTARKVTGFFAADEGEKAGTAPAFLTTVDGTLLAELGLGLGPTTNGSDCPECRHLGYRESFGRAYSVCTRCDRSGLIKNGKSGMCHRCRGAGRHWSPSQRRPIRCHPCRGVGFNTGYEECPDCHGTKTLWSKANRTFYEKCYKCGGSGELPMFNPVLIKGALRS